ncbi:MAG TPA: hypothetical protein VKU82_04040, partial [Planctomycetaceae bacterium]|nr:hypothetical protein [Planctomycetaceae bacterium]
GLIPIYTLLPKPGELGSVVSYLVLDEDLSGFGPNRQDLAQARVEVDVFGPIWSSLAFTAVMLSLSCLYVWRSDF